METSWARLLPPELEEVSRNLTSLRCVDPSVAPVGAWGGAARAELPKPPSSDPPTSSVLDSCHEEVALVLESCNVMLRDIARLKEDSAVVAKQSLELRGTSEAAVRESNRLNRTAEQVAAYLAPFNAVSLCGSLLGLNLVAHDGSVPQEQWVEALGEALLEAGTELTPDGSRVLRELRGSDTASLELTVECLVSADQELCSRLKTLSAPSYEPLRQRVLQYVRASRMHVARACGVLRSAVLDGLDAASVEACEAEIIFQESKKQDRSDGSHDALDPWRELFHKGASALEEGVSRRAIAPALQTLRRCARLISSKCPDVPELRSLRASKQEAETGAAFLLESAVGLRRDEGRGGQANPAADALVSAHALYGENRGRMAWGGVNNMMEAHVRAVETEVRGSALGEEGRVEELVRRAWEVTGTVMMMERRLMVRIFGLGEGSLSPLEEETRAMAESLAQAGQAMEEVMRRWIRDWGADDASNCDAIVSVFDPPGERAEAPSVWKLAAASQALVSEAKAGDAHPSLVRCAESLLATIQEFIEYTLYSSTLDHLAAAGTIQWPLTTEGNPTTAIVMAEASALRAGAEDPTQRGAELLFGFLPREFRETPEESSPSVLRRRQWFRLLWAKGHPVVERSAVLMSHLHRIIDQAAFRRVSADIVRSCILALRGAQRRIRDLPLTPIPAAFPVAAALPTLLPDAAEEETAVSASSAPGSALDGVLVRVRGLLELREHLGAFALSAGEGAEGDLDWELTSLPRAVSSVIGGFGSLLGVVSGAGGGDGGMHSKRRESALDRLVEELRVACAELVTVTRDFLLGRALRGLAETPVMDEPVTLQERDRANFERELQGLAAEWPWSLALVRRRYNLIIGSTVSHGILWRAVSQAIGSTLIQWRGSLLLSGFEGEASLCSQLLKALEASDALVSDPTRPVRSHSKP
jgi:hypothetical protein